MKLIVSFNLDNLLKLVMLAQKLIHTLMADHQFEKHVLCRCFWEVSFFSFFFLSGVVVVVFSGGRVEFHRAPSAFKGTVS